MPWASVILLGWLQCMMFCDIRNAVVEMYYSHCCHPIHVFEATYTYIHTYIHVHIYIHACIHTYVMCIMLLKFSIYRIFSVLMFMSEVPILGYSFERVQFLANLTNRIKHWHRMFVYVA